MKIIGAVLIVLSLVVAIAPLFTDCQSQGRAIVLENGKTDSDEMSLERDSGIGGSGSAVGAWDNVPGQ